MAENVRPYTLIRSDRKTVSIQIHEGGVIVRAPKRLAKREIDRFVADHAAWIESHLALSPVPQPLAFGDSVPLWGREARLVPDKSRHTTPHRIPEGVLAGDTLSFPADTPSLAAAMHKWYETETCAPAVLPYARGKLRRGGQAACGVGDASEKALGLLHLRRVDPHKRDAVRAGAGDRGVCSHT